MCLISEVSQRLDPHITINGLVLQDESIALTDLEHFGRFLLLDVEVEELVFEVLVCLTAVNDAVFRAIDLE